MTTEERIQQIQKRLADFDRDYHEARRTSSECLWRNWQAPTSLVEDIRLLLSEYQTASGILAGLLKQPTDLQRYGEWVREQCAKVVEQSELGTGRPFHDLIRKLVALVRQIPVTPMPPATTPEGETPAGGSKQP